MSGGCVKCFFILAGKREDDGVGLPLPLPPDQDCLASWGILLWEAAVCNSSANMPLLLLSFSFSAEYPL